MWELQIERYAIPSLKKCCADPTSNRVEGCASLVWGRRLSLWLRRYQDPILCAAPPDGVNSGPNCSWIRSSWWHLLIQLFSFLQSLSHICKCGLHDWRIVIDLYSSHLIQHTDSTHPFLLSILKFWQLNMEKEVWLIECRDGWVQICGDKKMVGLCHTRFSSSRRFFLWLGGCLWRLGMRVFLLKCWFWT